jgi:hypothetical protein
MDHKLKKLFKISDTIHEIQKELDGLSQELEGEPAHQVKLAVIEFYGIKFKLGAACASEIEKRGQNWTGDL